jgi:hypothetical protein
MIFMLHTIYIILHRLFAAGRGDSVQQAERRLASDGSRQPEILQVFPATSG